VFSGIIAHLGRVRSCDVDPRGGKALTLFAPTLVADGAEPKDSICVNGVCLTVVRNDDETLAFDVVPETLRRSNLGALRPGDTVNLEPSLRVGDRIGGHFVYGHADATVAMRSKTQEGQGSRLSFPVPPELARFIVPKGYVALDGVSLTVASVDAGNFDVALIPETAARTTLGIKGAGALVNLEIDPIARYALAAADPYEDRGGYTSDELAWAYEI
jgi:riboflavin synthase